MSRAWMGPLMALGALAAASPMAGQQQDSAAVARLEAVVDMIRRFEWGRAVAFAEAAYLPEGESRIRPAQHAGWLGSVHARAGAMEVRSIGSAGPGRAGALVWNPLTEEYDSLFVTVEATSPWRIRMPGMRPGVGYDTAASVSAGGLHAQLDGYVRRLAGAGRFSGVVLVAKDGRPLFLEAYGVANRDFDTPVRTDTKFNLGSMNKNFTAVAIAQLVDEGRIAWEDPLSKFLPDFPDSAAAAKIQIRHLLTHTAGLGSYFNRRFFESSRALYRTVDDMMGLARPDSLRFEPGTGWAYSNTGYLVLGKVIEVVTGRDYYDYIRERIYRPVGMPDTDSWELDHVNPNLAVGYYTDFGSSGPVVRNNVFEHVLRGGPAGGGYSTAEDLLRYAEALRQGRLVRRETVELMRAPKPEIASPRYGYGFVRWRGDGIWGHGGDFPGVDADLEIYADTGYVVIVLANQDGMNDPILRRARRLLTAEGMRLP